LAKSRSGRAAATCANLAVYRLYLGVLPLLLDACRRSELPRAGAQIRAPCAHSQSWDRPSEGGGILGRGSVLKFSWRKGAI
jgi:hypothetical protein